MIKSPRAAVCGGLPAYHNAAGKSAASQTLSIGSAGIAELPLLTNCDLVQSRISPNGRALAQIHIECKY
jgi:hypothetical protein